METNRREFVILTIGAAAAATRPTSAGAQESRPSASPSASSDARVVDAGAVSDFAKDRVYDQFRDQGFFVIRRGGKLYALSSICTHKGCKVRPQADQSFLCKCHKSTFDREGRVVSGPAPADLPRLAVKRAESDRLLVDLDRRINAMR